MSGTQVQNGKAFEWAVASAWRDLLKVDIEIDAAAKGCKACYLSVSPKTQSSMDKAASAAVGHIFSLENLNPVVKQPLSIRLATDAKGQTGDVRDVLIVGSGGTLGFSCKNNHDAFKHPRLSGKIDFVKQWGLDPRGCSEAYWKVVSCTFKALCELRDESGGMRTWASIPEYQKEFYKPVLDAFGAELLRLKEAGPSQEQKAVKGLLAYLIGRHDFYKVVRRAKHHSVEIQGFNSQGTLAVPKPKSADQIVSVKDAGNGEWAKVVYLTNYTFKFRIHNAKSKVEPSLKFDVRAEALPNVYSHHIAL